MMVFWLLSVAGHLSLKHDHIVIIINGQFTIITLIILVVSHNYDRGSTIVLACMCRRCVELWGHNTQSLLLVALAANMSGELMFLLTTSRTHV